MRWTLILPAAAAVALLAGAACGDGDAKPAASATVAASPTARPQTGQPTTSQPLPTPTPVAETALALQVVSGTNRYLPTLKEVKALPQTELEIDGQKQKGILLKDLVAKVPPGRSGIVTIEGLRADMQHVGSIRFALADVAETTLLVLTDRGHLDLVSSTIPKEQWLKVVTGVVFS